MLVVPPPAPVDIRQALLTAFLVLILALSLGALGYQLLLRRRARRARAWRTQYTVGRATYGEPRVLTWGEAATLTVGSFCSIADGVSILLGGNHRVDWITTYPFSVLREAAKDIPGHPATRGDVVIGNDVWIGMNATILSGVRIGDGAVIGACSVVTRDVPPYGVVAGNPATLVRRRFTDDEIDRLTRLAWWEWPDEDIDAAMPLLLAGDVTALSTFAENARSPHPGLLSEGMRASS